MRLTKRTLPLLAVGLPAAMLTVSAKAQDNVSIVVPRDIGTGGKAIGAFGYKPDTDGPGPDVEAIYVTAFGFSGTDGNPTIRKVVGIGQGQTPTGTTLVSEAQMRFFYANGDPANGVVGSIGGSSLLLNPLPIGTGPTAIPAWSRAWTNDGVTVTDGDSSNGTLASNAISDRYVRYSLNAVTSNPDALTQFTTLMNLSDYQARIDVENGASPAPTTAFIPIRQAAWSRDGQWQYLADSNATYGGVWRLDPVNPAGSIRAVTAPAAQTNTEIAVIAPPSGTGDRILFQGKTGFNPGGINYVDYNGTAVTADADVKVFLPAATLADFLDNAVAGRTGTAAVTSINSDGNGTVFFQENTWDVTVAVDPQGRLWKVNTRDERTAALAPAGQVAGSNSLRLQARQAVTPQGFTRTQVLTTDNGAPESIVGDSVVGAFYYSPGDFNRDNVVAFATQTTDTAPFLAALQPRRAYTTATLPAVSKFDVNGNRTVDWKDVKILQQWVGFNDGDANLDMRVDLTDLNVLRDHYYTTAGNVDKTWAQGDFASLAFDATTYLPSAADANLVNYVDVLALANAWVNTLGQPAPTTADYDANGYAGQFRTDVMTAFAAVPEPSSAAIAALALVPFVTRRRRRV